MSEAKSIDQLEKECSQVADEIFKIFGTDYFKAGTLAVMGKISMQDARNNISYLAKFGYIEFRQGKDEPEYKLRLDKGQRMAYLQNAVTELNAEIALYNQLTEILKK